MRVFKTKWFAREARSHAITDEVMPWGAFLKSAFTKIVSVQLFWRKEEAIGFTRFYMQNRICRTSIVRNWLGFVKLQSIMPS